MNFLSKYKWGDLVQGIVTLIIGVLVIVFAIVDQGVIGEVVSYVLAAALFLYGLITIVVALISHTKELFTASLISASLAIAIGVVLCVNPGLLASFFTLFLGVFLITYGAVSLIKGIFLIVYKAKWVWYVITFVIAAVCITVGILALIPETVGDLMMVLYIIVGAVISIYGIIGIVSGVKKLSK